MRFLVILASLSLLGLCLGGWGSALTILTTRTPIIGHWSYLDSSTYKVHVIYTAYEDDNYVFYYTSRTNSGQTITPLRLTNFYAAHNGTDCASITGSNDGRHIYVLLNAKRGTYDEMYYIESYSDGLYFSDPIYPRSSNIDDFMHRSLPRLVFLYSNTLLIAYNTNGNLTYATRSPFNVVWSNEKTLVTEPSKRGPVVGLSAVEYILDNTQECITIAALCKKSEDNGFIQIFTTTNIGKDWNSVLYPMSGHPYSDMVPVVVSNSTGSMFFSALRNYAFSSFRRAGILFERRGNSYEQFSSFPISNGTSHSLQFCEIQGEPTLIYYLQSDVTGWSAYSLLLQIPEKVPETYQRLSSPRLSHANEREIHIQCDKNLLYATGIDYYNYYDYYYLQLLFYSFP